MSNYKTVFFTLGLLQIILGLSMIIPVLIQLVYSESDSGFIVSGLATIIFGMLFYLSNLDHDKKINLQQAFLLTSLSWLSIAIFGSLPFIFSEINLSLTDAFFESMSGITTTGSTIISNLNDTPKSILLWRSMLQWLGGIGIIVMAITLMPIMNVGGMQLFKISTNDKTEKVLPKTKEISLRLILIYLSLTFLCSILYKICGMNFFDSFTHAMTTIATGGFSNYNESIGYFNNSYIEIIFISDSQIKLFFKIVIFSIFFLFIYLSIVNKNFYEIDFLSVSFNVVSVLTGTGYVTENYSSWGNFPLFFFLILMFIGGCAGSTTCGIKIFRVQILYQFFSNQIKKIIYPHGVFNMKYEKQNIDEKFMSSVISFIYLYFIIFFIVTSLLTINGLDLVSALSAAATAISNVGPGLGDTIGPNGNFAEISNNSKWILSFAMILGRLELFAILVLFIPSFWRKF